MTTVALMTTGKAVVVREITVTTRRKYGGA